MKSVQRNLLCVLQNDDKEMGKKIGIFVVWGAQIHYCINKQDSKRDNANRCLSDVQAGTHHTSSLMRLFTLYFRKFGFYTFYVSLRGS